MAGLSVASTVAEKAVWTAGLRAALKARHEADKKAYKKAVH